MIRHKRNTAMHSSHLLPIEPMAGIISSLNHSNKLHHSLSRETKTGSMSRLETEHKGHQPLTSLWKAQLS
jgi:hypothetical protein